MKLLRPILLAVIFAGAFFYFTTYRSGPMHPANWFGRPIGKVEITEAASGESLDAEEQNNIGVYRKNIDSVVNITSRAVTFDFFYGLVPQEGQGSGFIIDKEGHMLTNYHVIAEARQVEVTLHNRKKYRATVVGTDRSHDLAVIQIKGPGLTPMVLGDSRNLQVGQKVYAIGNPFGLSGTMTRGIISSIRPVQEPDGMQIDEAIQTDAAINPGNSGGPLLNWHGEVIGINTLIASNVGQSAGIGFAIPVNTAKAVLNDLMTLGRVRRPALGVRTIPITPGTGGPDGPGRRQRIADRAGGIRWRRRPRRPAWRHRARLHRQPSHHDRRRPDRCHRWPGGPGPAGPKPGHEQSSRRRHGADHDLSREKEDGCQRDPGRGARTGLSQSATDLRGSSRIEKIQ